MRFTLPFEQHIFNGYIFNFLFNVLHSHYMTLIVGDSASEFKFLLGVSLNVVMQAGIMSRFEIAKSTLIWLQAKMHGLGMSPQKTH